jgi:tetratricopeptide (TPR) repeat protein
MNLMRYILIILLFTGLVPGSLYGQDEHDDYLQGVARMSEGKYQEAIANFSGALTRDPGKNEYYLKRAECRYALQDYAGALTDLGNIDNQEIRSLLAARCHARTGNVAESLQYLEKHLRSPYKQPENILLLDPAFDGLENNSQWKALWRKEWYDDDERNIAEVNFLIRKEKYLDALELLNQDAEALSSRHELLALRAEAFLGLGNLNNCITDLTAAIGRNGSIPSYYNRRAEVYGRQGKYNKAVEDYTRSLQLDPDQLNVYYERAQAYRAMNEPGKAAVDMEFLVRYFPDNEKYLYETGRDHQLNKNYLGALKRYNSLLQISKDSASYFQARGETYLATRIYRYAEKDFSMALDLDPYNSACYLNKGLARFYQGDTQGACTDWSKAYQYGSDEAANLLVKHCK